MCVERDVSKNVFQGIFTQKYLTQCAPLLSNLMMEFSGKISNSRSSCRFTRVDSQISKERDDFYVANQVTHSITRLLTGAFLYVSWKWMKKWFSTLFHLASSLLASALVRQKQPWVDEILTTKFASFFHPFNHWKKHNNNMMGEASKKKLTAA